MNIKRFFRAFHKAMKEEIEEELGFILLHPAKKAVANNIGIIFNFFIIPLN